MKITKHPLVSVVVITYNSGKYILETLESIKEQTYPNIELIISDDNSKDNTISICQEWTKKNSSRFKNIQIITYPTNTGIPSNCNRGYRAAQGDWIKGIAGDDALEKECISQYIEFINNHPQASVCHSKQHCYNDTFSINSLNPQKEIKIPYCLRTVSPNSQKQFLYLGLTNSICAPTVFIKKSLFDSVGGYDETIPMCEDYPMWLKITRKGYPFYFLDKYTILYRMHSNSVFGNNNVSYLFKCFFGPDNIVYHQYIKPYMPFIIRFTHRYDYYLRLFLYKINLNKINPFTRSMYYLLSIPYKLLFKGIQLFLDYKFKHE